MDGIERRISTHPPQIRVGDRQVGLHDPTYFVADIGANHDGDLERAKALIWLARDAGADAAKFQHFKADLIVSDVGFRALGAQLGHQANWDRPVVEVYRAYELNRQWDETLSATARSAGIDFMTTPYDMEAARALAPMVPAFKIGSGDITWVAFVKFVASLGKPLMLATGASNAEDVARAVDAARQVNPDLVLMQCNTNYTGSIENFHHINLNVLKTYAGAYPELVLGLSDHSPGHATALGAIALGARVVEKHFTDDVTRKGPDHGFAMSPQAWRDMVLRSRELEAALGDGIKRVEDNERDTAVVQQRCLRFNRDMRAGETVADNDLQALRPAEPAAARPYEAATVVGRTLRVARACGEAVFIADLEPK